MELYQLLSNNKDVTGYFMYALSIFVALGAWRVYRDKALHPNQQGHLTVLCLALLVVAFSFFKPVWGVWSGTVAMSLFTWAYAVTSVKQNIVSRGIKMGATFAVGVALLGIVTGLCPSVSMGPSMWPQTSKSPGLSLLNVNAFKNASPSYGDDIEFRAQSVEALDKTAVLPWEVGNFRKRVWAVAGDTIRIDHQGIKLNGTQIADCSNPKEKDIVQQVPKVWLCDAHFPNGKHVRFVWGDANQFLYPTFEVTVKHDQLFVIGDNTVESGDSREYGPIMEQWVLGRFVNDKMTSQPWKAW